MAELFRFVVLRPAAPTNSKTVAQVKISPDLARDISQAKSTVERVATLAKRTVITNLNDYKYGDAMYALSKTGISEKKLRELTGQTAQSLIESDAFKQDVLQLDDTLVTLKYRSSAPGVDVDVLRGARIGYDLVKQAANGTKPDVRSFVFADGIASNVLPKEIPEIPQPEPSDIDAKIASVVASRQALRDAMRTGFSRPVVSNIIKFSEDGAEIQQKYLGGRIESPWRLGEDALHTLPENITNSIKLFAGDPSTTSAIALSTRLNSAYASLAREKTKLEFVEPNAVHQIGSNWYSRKINPSQLRPPWKIGQISFSGNIKPVGVGDLLIVREHIKRYEGGELGHIENVLSTEKLDRNTRRLERSEQTTTVDTETNKDEERDTQSTDRFSLKRETDNTVKTDAQIKAGLSVDAKYGPFVEVKADLQGSYQNQTENVTKQSTEFSKDVVSRSVSKLATKVRQLQTTVTTTEWEEKYSHGFDNSHSGSKNVSGIYQFVDKVSEAQIYNYGKRLLFDIMVPEPAAFYIWAQQRTATETTHLTEPTKLYIKPSDLNIGNYQIYAQAYGATGIDPPPPEHVTVSQAWDFSIADPYYYTKSGTITINDGYSAIHAAAVGAYYHLDKYQIIVLVGSQSIDLATCYGEVSMSSEEGTVGVCIQCGNVNSAAISLEVLCERTERAFEVWQEKAYGTIFQAYQQKLSDYERGLADLQTAQAVAITGSNPETNASVMTAELRKACIEQLTVQHFDLFGAVGTDSAGRPETDIGRLEQQGPFVRFFEEAFEWERIVYFFYPYFWASKSTWQQRALLDDSNDPAFADFLRAGAARVVFPVRPGFEAAVVHYLDTGLIWNGGDPPDISSNLYLPIIQEVAEAQQRPGKEVPVGKPWDVHVPTQLVSLRADDMLPRWKKVGDEWQPEPLTKVRKTAK